MRLPLRMRVAAAFAATTVLLLVALGWLVYAGVERTLLDQARDALRTSLDSLASVPSAEQGEALQRLGDDQVGQVLDRSGEVVAASARAPTPLVEATEPPGVLERRVALAGQDEPEVMLLAVRRQGDRTLVVGRSREDVADALQQALVLAAVAGVAGLGVALLLGYVVAGVALRPVEAMRRRAEAVSAERSGERLPVPPGNDELHRLGRTLNDMLDRLDEGLQRERRFVAEAGHELRTPLALLRTEIDLAVSGDRSYDELLAALRSSGEEVDRLTELAESLLAITTGGAEREIVDLTVMARETATRFASVAGSRGPVAAGSEELLVSCDRASVTRVLANLVDNALRHGAGTVTLTCAREGEGVQVVVTDEGDVDPVLAASAGLGLAIADEVATQHGGTLTLRSRPAGGTEAVLWLPGAATSAAPR